ncbi:MAG: ABC transporter ATP-binding protein [Gemmatimonadota bacterium]|nr:ABC transporter ATP-binding protein [Gemmatimonadota bacterium]
MPTEQQLTAPPVLELVDVVRRFGATVALDCVNLAVPPGTILGLIGRNGAGKTTAIRILAGLLEPDEGTARVGGEDPMADRQTVMTHAGFLLNDLALFTYLTAEETLNWLGDVYRQPRQLATVRTEELMRFFGLTEVRDRLAEDLSTGMRKRLALAAAMIHVPAALVLDEPFESLDPLMVRRLKDLLRRYASSGGAVLLSSHLVDVVEELCDRIAILEMGSVRAYGHTREVLSTVDERLPRRTLEELYASLVPSEDPGALDWLVGRGFAP